MSGLRARVPIAIPVPRSASTGPAGGGGETKNHTCSAVSVFQYPLDTIKPKRAPCVFRFCAARAPSGGATFISQVLHSFVGGMSKLQLFGMAAAAVAAGTVYVLVHEARRKAKKARAAEAAKPISKEMLLTILNKSAEHSKAVIEHIRTEVKKIQQQRSLSDDQALRLFQENFEHSLDQLIGRIRSQYKVTEKAMDASFKLHQADPEVKQAIQNMRMLSAATGNRGTPAAPESPSRSGSGGATAGGGAATTVTLPASLTKDRLREIMTFNAVMLEKELRPIKEEVERLRKQGRQTNLDPNLLMQVQLRISEAVQSRFGVSDEQVMAAVEAFGAKSDPSFKDILQRIATTLQTSLG